MTWTKPRLFTGREKDPFSNRDIPCPLTPNEVSTLAVYNSEKMRGLIHTVMWQLAMGQFQRLYDEWTKKCADAAGMVTIVDKD